MTTGGSSDHCLGTRLGGAGPGSLTAPSTISPASLRNACGHLSLVIAVFGSLAIQAGRRRPRLTDPPIHRLPRQLQNARGHTTMKTTSS